MRPNDPKLSDGGGWRDGCVGEGGGAASVTAGAVRGMNEKKGCINEVEKSLKWGPDQTQNQPKTLNNQA
jgi:membrane protease subunit (stomatin/prohibitin family)